MSGHSVNYGAGNVDLSASSRLNDGYIVRGVGLQIATPAGLASSVAVSNVSTTWVRGIITIAPAFTGSTAGNTAFAIPPGGTFQETFVAAAIQSIAFIGVDTPAVSGTVAVTALVPNLSDYLLAVKFLES